MNLPDAILATVAGLIAVRYVWGLINEAERKSHDAEVLLNARIAWHDRLVARAVIRQMEEHPQPEAKHPLDEIPYNLRKVIMPEPEQTDRKDWN